MDSTQTLISLGQAFRHCAATGSYWGWLIGIVVIGIVGFWYIGRLANRMNKSLDTPRLIWAIVFILLTALAIFMRPTSLQQNTTLKQAAEGHYIGY